MKSSLDEQPNDGEWMAQFTANGNWRFSLVALDGSHERDFWKEDDITPEIETAIKGASDGDTVTLDGTSYRYDCRENNWFEVFAFKYRNGEWNEIDFQVDEADVGPTADELRSTLQDYLDSLAATTDLFCPKCGKQTVTLNNGDCQSFFVDEESHSIEVIDVDQYECNSCEALFFR